MNVKQLRYALKVASSGSFTKAAKELYLSQPSLSKAITNLESDYQIKIFDRKSKGVYVTPEGKEFLYYAKKVITSVDAMDEILSSKKENKRQSLSIASQQVDFLYDLLMEAYEGNKENSLHVNVVEGNRSNVIDAVLNGDVNIGIIVRSSEDSTLFKQMLLEANLEINVIDTSEVYVNIGKKSPHYHKDKLTFEELKNDQQIVLDMEDKATQDLYMSRSSFINTNQVLFFNTINACIAFLLSTETHLYTPKWLLGFFKDEEIKSLPVSQKDGYFPTLELIWLKRKNEALTKIETDFIKRLKEIL